MYRLVLVLVLTLASLAAPLTAAAAPLTPFQQADAIRAALLDAQLQLADDPTGAAQKVTDAQSRYAGEFRTTLSKSAPAADARIRSGLTAAEKAIAARDSLALADARAQVWTALLAGGYTVVEKALTDMDAPTAESWLSLREFRRATRFSRPNADATRAVHDFANGKLSAADALAAVRADVLDTYQARLKLALDDALKSEQSGYATRRAENASLAEGYFEILAPSFGQQRGAQAAATAQQAFDGLRAAARANTAIAAAVAQLTPALQDFRAAPLSAADQSRRAGQLNRFLKLVPVEYGRGVSAGIVTADLEIQEATTFRDGAEAAFTDLSSLLAARDANKTAQIAALFDQLEKMLADTSARSNVAGADEVQRTTDEIAKLVAEVSPAEWAQRNSEGDFDVVASLLDQMENAAANGQYDLAESARLDAYAVMESGPEARLVAAAPQLKTPIEDLFWNGQGEAQGLAYLIRERAPIQKIKASRIALDAQLADAQKELASSSAPAAVATNAGIIVFREGLEAVLILAALMSSMKLGEARRLRRPIWLGVAFAFVATMLTWLLAQTVLSALARYGEMLEAAVSLLAIGVLLLILNWFFHKVYWTGWIGTFQTRKRSILGQTAGQMLGLAILGFTSVYREGFESVLFLQALVLEAGANVVLIGAGIGLALVLLIGLATFILQAKLPYKRMLIVTGVMIAAVLVVMVGNTVHVMQVVGWMPITPIRGLDIPYWMGTWFGVYPTVETIGAQVLAMVYVLGSYYLAERQNRRGTRETAHKPPTLTPARPEEKSAPISLATPSHKN